MIVALCTVVVLLAVAAPSLAQGSGGSNLASPCPGVFGYAPPWPESGLWAGVATLSTEYLLHSLWLEIVLDSPARGFGQLWHWVGNTTTQDNVQFKIENYDLEIHPDHPMIVRFFVQYDPLNTAPRLRVLRLNGKVICNVEPHQRVIEDRPVLFLSEKPLQPPQSNYPVYQRTVNNSNADFKPEIPFSNTQASFESVGCGVGLGGRITYYSEDMTYMRGEIPWLVAIYKRDATSLKFLCVGTLVSNRHVVTVANCIQLKTRETAVRDFVIKVGVHDVNDRTEDIATRKLISASLHEDYDPKTLQNNILILTLNQRVPFNDFIRPACLWSGDTELERIVGASGLIAGWGIRSPGHTGFHDVPYAVRVPIVSTSQCRASNPLFHVITSNTTFCAGDRNGVGPCIGDSGAGLYLLDGGRWRLRGLVSLALRPDDGSNGCNLNEYIVYTDTAKYLPWIRNILSQKYFD